MRRAGWPIDEFLRSAGYVVHSLPDLRPNSEGHVPDLTDVPRPIDVVVCHDWELTPFAIEVASQVGAKYVFPSYRSKDLGNQKLAEEAGVEFIRGITIEEAYKRVMQAPTSD